MLLLQNHSSSSLLSTRPTSSQTCAFLSPPAEVLITSPSLCFQSIQSLRSAFLCSAPPAPPPRPLSSLSAQSLAAVSCRVLHLLSEGSFINAGSGPGSQPDPALTRDILVQFVQINSLGFCLQKLNSRRRFRSSSDGFGCCCV